jgi:hypothetical protein
MKKYFSLGLGTLFVLISLVVVNIAIAGAPVKTINSVLLNGGSSVSVSPSTVVTASVNVTSQNGASDRWLSTKYQIGTSSSICVDTTDHQGSTNTESFSITSPSGSGTYDFKVWIYSDNVCTNNQVGPTTLTGGIVVVADTTAPISSITSPSIGAYLRGTLSVTANATDTGSGVQSVVFHRASTDPTIIGSDISFPYSIDWDTTSVTDGSHDLWVDAYDNSGNHATSSSVAVIVDNTPPVLNLPSNIILEATNPSGEVVNYSASSTDNINPANPVVTCTPISGSTFTLGTTTVNCSASDTAGNLATSSFQVIIQDTTPPVITPPVDQMFEATGSSTSPVLIPATASDLVDATPAVTPSQTDFLLGTTTVTWTATDDSGNTSATTSIVGIIDTTPATLTVLGSNPFILLLKASFIDPWVTAVDLVDGDISSFATSTNNINNEVIGVYSVTYTSIDSSGNATTTSRVVNVVDQEAPVINLLGENLKYTEVGQTYVDPVPPVSAMDNYDGDITSQVVSSSTINTNVLGAYYVDYNVADSSGNEAATTTRTVIVQDTTAPVITITSNDDAHNHLKVGDPAFVDPGATATDNYDSSVVVTATGTVNTLVAGTYLIEYNAIDSSLNQAATTTRTVIVRELGVDSSLIELSVTGETLVPVFATSTFNYTVLLPLGTTVVPPTLATTTDSNASATTTNATTITATTTATTTINVMAENGIATSTYTIVFSVSSIPPSTDSSLVGMSTSQGSLVPAFVSSTFSYNVTLPTGATTTPTLYATTTNSGATTIITNAIDVTSATTSDRTSTVAVTAEDGIATSTYSVIFAVTPPDTTSPVITILGSNPISLTVGDSYSDLGATATDNIDGDITSQIATTNNVNTGTAGSYAVTYVVHDVAMNYATSTRTVNVSNPTPPSYGGGGGAPFFSVTPATSTLKTNVINPVLDVNGNPIPTMFEGPMPVPAPIIVTGEGEGNTGTGETELGGATTTTEGGLANATTSATTTNENNANLAAAAGASNFPWSTILWTGGGLLVLVIIGRFLYLRRA